MSPAQSLSVELPKLIATFLHERVYSPVRLANQLGWEPTPRGYTPPKSFALDGTNPLDVTYRPEYADQKPIFGWLDAFEDLMRVNSGLELSDLDTKHATVHKLWHLSWTNRSDLEFPRLRHVRNMMFHISTWSNNSWHFWFPSFLRQGGKTSPNTPEEWLKAREQEREFWASRDELTEQRKRFQKLLGMDVNNIIQAQWFRGVRNPPEEHLAVDKDGSSFFGALALSLPLMHYQLRNGDLVEHEAALSQRPPDQSWPLATMLTLISMFADHPVRPARDYSLLVNQGRFFHYWDGIVKIRDRVGEGK